MSSDALAPASTSTSKPAAEASADVSRSPGLAAFRLNAFRVLRLPITAAANEAVWKSEKILARRRAGLDDPEPEIVGWLPLPDEIDLREAAQRVEEPLRRLRDQLLWFDLGDGRDDAGAKAEGYRTSPASPERQGDPKGALLRRALVEADADALAAYLATDEKDLKAADAEEPEGGEGEGEVDYEAVARQRQMPVVAHRLNQANLRLLLAFSWMHDVGPSIAGGVPGAAAAAPRIAWKAGEGIETAKRVHALFPSAPPEGRVAAWPAMLKDALTRWGDLLKNPWLSSYVEEAILALGDDLVTSDDVEPLTNALATAIADAVVGEMKITMLAGAVDRVLEICAIATASGIDPTHWTAAFRPLRALFRAELDELGTLIDPSKPANVRDIDLYLQRVRALGATWASVDTGEAFGLDQMIDAAVNQAIDRVRAIENASAVLDRLEEVLKEAATTAKSPSTAERAREMMRNVASHREGLCVFCGKRTAKAASCGVLKGKKEIRRERVFNGVRITYATTSSLVARCETCASSTTTSAAPATRWRSSRPRSSRSPSCSSTPSWRSWSSAR